MTERDPAGSGWHLDKRVPVALIFTIVMQSAVAIWWAATMNEISAQATRERAALSSRVARIENERNSMSDRITRLETKLDTQTSLLTDILREIRKGQR